MEVEVGVLGNREPIASVVGEIVANADWYDFEAKYAEGGMELIVPARLPADVLEGVQRLAVESFVATDCEGMARVDFFVRPDGDVVVNELNTIPGFTATSVYAKLFAESGISYAALLDRLVDARARAPRAPARARVLSRAPRPSTAASASSQAPSASSSTASSIVSGQSTRMQLPACRP